MNDPHFVAFYLVGGFQPLDLFGPLEAFAAASASLQAAGYRTVTASLDGAPVVSESGVRLLPDVSLEALSACDTLILVGGCGPRLHSLSDPERRMLLRIGSQADRIASVCTGTFLLAQLGLLDGCEATTHWRHAEALAAQHPGVSVNPDAIYLRSGKLWTSAGVTSGIDMALGMIGDDHGSAVTMAVARELVIYLHRTGNQAQFSEALRLQAPDDSRLTALLDWAARNLDQNLNVERLARDYGTSERNFRRLVRTATGYSPSELIERLRLDRARTLLSAGNARISSVAMAVGFRRADTFARAFERAYGISPSDFSARFASPTMVQTDRGLRI